MKRVELEHVLRASAAITLDTSFVVIGSQSVLLDFPEAPAELLLFNELDLYPALHPERADLFEGRIGQLSMFHDAFGYHADGVSPETATTPADGMTFAKLHYIGELTAICHDLHDIAVLKCVAGRYKDAGWVRGVLRHRIITIDRLVERLQQLDASARPPGRLIAWARRRAQEALA